MPEKSVQKTVQKNPKKSKKKTVKKKNKVSDDEIIEHAKDLYLTVNEEGGHKYSFREIEQILNKELGVQKKYNTIQNWAKKNDWERLFQDSKNLGMEKAINEKLDKESAIIDRKSDEVAEKYQALNEVFKSIAGEFIKRKADKNFLKDVPVKDLSYILNQTLDRLKNFLDLDNPKKDKLDDILDELKKL
ncbi:MAG TPA: hypothetical protein DHW82_00400 [Spirochaetia bacterium]|nr:MAG: hypothetical protein A2Y41_07235 [Spirochaetes bacterium GWB1_36_13]HCL55459.1 hypothetical protein [Spirochaetia bacterium]